MEHTQVLELAADFPISIARPGEIIIQEEGDSPELLVLETGTVEVIRAGQLVAVIDQPGAILGEISMLLSSPSTADVVARGEVKLRVLADPEIFLATHPELALFIARQLAERLARASAYLADLKDEFDGPDGQMGLVPQIVSELLTWRRLTAEAAEAAEAAATADTATPPPTDSSTAAV